jgi:hypothetical protein
VIPIYFSIPNPSASLEVPQGAGCPLRFSITHSTTLVMARLCTRYEKSPPGSDGHLKEAAAKRASGGINKSIISIAIRHYAVYWFCDVQTY